MTERQDDELYPPPEHFVQQWEQWYQGGQPTEAGPPPAGLTPTHEESPPPAPEQPPPPPTPETDPAIAAWEELVRRRPSADAPPPEPEPQPELPPSPLVQELESSGILPQMESMHRRAREMARGDAARQSAERARLVQGERGWLQATGDVVREVPTFARAAATVTPGGIISGYGSALQGPDVAHARMEYATQEFRLWQLQAIDAMDGGASPGDLLAEVRRGRPEADPRRGGIDRRYDAFLIAYNGMSPAERRQERERIDAEFAAFNPTRIQDRTLYQYGQAVQEYGRTFHENVLGLQLPEGYDEHSYAVQLGRGLGSMVAGIPVTMLTGPVGGAVFFGAMGAGEATQRAVEFDRREREAGRPGLTQDQIIMSGLFGYGPGTTDVLPIQILLARLSLRMPARLLSHVARSIGLIGGQAFVEGAQEGGQQFLQNLIAWHVYNPNQVMTEEVWGNILVGSGVGATAEGGRQVLSGGLRLARGARGGGSRTDAQPPPQRQEQTPQQPEVQRPTDVAPTPDEEEQRRAPFGMDRWAPETRREPAGEQEPPPAPRVAPEEERPPARTPEAILGRVAEQLPPDILQALRRLEPELAAKYEAPAPRQEDAQPDLSSRDDNLQIGREREITTPGSEMRVTAVPELVELADLQPATGALQPRDRSRAEAQQAVREIAANLDPEQLMPGRVSDAGAPIVTADRTVISGNGRVAAIRQAYTQAPLKAKGAAYKNSLGAAAKGLKRPVLVMRLREMPQEDLARFADLSNRSRITAMSATERAARDAAAAGADVMSLYQGGEFRSPANGDFFRAFVDRVVSGPERGAFSRQGELTKEGQDRMRAAVLAAAYGDPDLLSRMLESTDDNIRSLTGALQDAAGAFIRLKAAIARGEADAKFDITLQIVDAVRRIADMRDRGIKPAAFLAQQDAFEARDPLVDALIRAFYTNDLGRPLGRQKLTEFFNAYAQEAAKHTAEGLIPDQTTPADIIAAAYRRATVADTLAERLARAQGDLLTDRLARVEPEPPGGPSAGRRAAAADRRAARGRQHAGRSAEASTTAPARAEQLGQPAANDPETARRFASILAGKLPSTKWAQSLGMSDEQLQGWVDRAVTAGLVRIDSNGTPRRTELAKTASLDALVSGEDLTTEAMAERFAPAELPTGATAAEPAAGLPTWEDIVDRLPPDALGDPDSAGLQRRMVRDYGKDSWAGLSDEQKAELFRQLDEEARGRPEREPIFALTSERQGRNDARTALMVNKNYRIDDRHQEAVWGELSKRAHEFPAYIRPAVLKELRSLPVTPERRAVAIKLGQAPVDTLAIFSMPDGTVFTQPLTRQIALTTRGVFLPDARVLAFMSFGGRGERFEKAIAGVQRHELVHALRFGARLGQGIPPGDWLALLFHAKHLRVLDMRLSDYIDLIGQQQTKDQRTNRITLRQAYDSAYAKYGDNRSGFIDEEFVAHMVELRSLGLLPDHAVAPVKEIIDRIIAGHYAQPSIVQQALRERGDLDDGDLHALTVARVDESAASALEALNRPETTPEQALALLKELGRLRAERNRLRLANPDIVLAIGEGWTDEELEQLYRDELEEAGRKVQVRESVARDDERALRRRAEPRSALTRQAEKLAKEVADAEKALAAEGKTAAEIAQALSARFNIEVEPEQIAASLVWWRVDDILAGESGRTGKGRFAKTVFTADVVAEMKRAWGDVRSFRELVEHLSEYTGRQMNWHSVAKVLLKHAGTVRNPVRVSEAKAAEETFRSALLGEDMRELPATTQAAQLTERLGRKITPRMVRERRAELGVYYRQEAAKLAAEQRLRDALQSEAIRDLPLEDQAKRLSTELGRPVTWHMILERRRQLGIRRQYTAQASRPEIDAFLLSDEGKALAAPEAAEALARQLGRGVSQDMVWVARRRLTEQGRDVGDHRASLWTSEADAFVLSEEGRHMTASQLAGQLSKLLAKPITMKAVYGRRAVLRSRGHKIDVPGRLELTPEEIAQFTAEDVRGLSDRAAAAVLSQRLGRKVGHGVVWKQRQKLVEDDGGASDTLLAAFAAPPGDGGPVKPLREIIADLKEALSLTVTQGVRRQIEVVDQARGMRRVFRTPKGAVVRGQYDQDAGVARVAESATDIEAIARQGGRHLERLYGADLEAFKQTYVDEIGIAPAPDTPLPALNSTGFSGMDLDGDTQTALIDAANGLRTWRQLMAAPDRRTRERNRVPLRRVASETAAAMTKLERRLGPTIARALVGDLIGDPGLPNNGILGDTPHRLRTDALGREVGILATPSSPMIDPARLAEYVRERYSATGTPRARPDPNVAPELLSNGFAQFFERYVLNQQEAERRFPGMYQAFEDFLDAEHPAMLENLQRLQVITVSKDYQRYTNATTLDQGRADLATDADQRFTTWARRLAAQVGEVDNFKALANYLYTRGVAEHNPHDQLVRRLLEEGDKNLKPGEEPISLAVHENPAKLIRSVSDAFKTGLRWLQAGMPVYRHADAGWQVVAADGVTRSGTFPTLAQAQAAAAAAPGSAIQEVAGKRSRSINEALTLAGAFDSHETYKDFGVYLESRRAAEEWKRWEAQGSKPQADGKGLQREPHRVPRAQHEQRIRELEALHPTFPQAAQAVYDFVWASAVHDHAAGRYDDAKLAYRATRRHFHVPYSRDFSDTYNLGVSGTRARVRRFMQDLAFRGSKRDVRHPIETIVDQAFSRAAATAMNEVTAAYANVAESVGPGGAAIVERVTRTDVVQANSEAFRRLEADIAGMGYQPDDAHDIVMRLEAEWTDQNLLLQSTAPTAGRPLLVPLYERGTRNFLRINDPQFAQEIWQSLNGIGREMSSLVVDFLAAPARLLRVGVTTAAGFIAVNPVRDSLAAWVVTGAIPGYTQIKGLGHELLQTQTAKMYGEVGGIFGGVNVATLSRVKDRSAVMDLQYTGLAINPKGLAAGAAIGGGLGFMMGGPGGAAFGALAGMAFHRGVRHFGSTIAHFADVSETATRFGVYDKAYKAALAYNPHLTPYQAAQEAAFVARDLIDYSRRGSRMLSVARVVTFANAAIQGLDRATRGLLARSDRGSQFSPTKLVGIMAAGAATGFVAGPLVGTALALTAPAIAANAAARSAAARALLAPFFKKHAGLPLSRDDQRAMAESGKMWARLMVLTAALAAIGLAYSDDDRYRRFASRMRSRYQPLFPLDDSQIAEWLALPKPWEFGLPATVLEAAVDAQFRNDPRFAERVREAMWDTLVPPGIPQAVTLWGDVRSNYDSFRQRQLVPDRLRTLPPDLQFDAYSSQFAIRLSRFVNGQPWLRSTAEGVGSTVFATRFELTPAVIDHMLRTGLGHWGSDIQRGSDTAAFGASRVRDWPLVGSMMQRFIVDPTRTSDAMMTYYELVGREHEGYRRAATGYRERRMQFGPDEANAWLASLHPEQRAYALLEESGVTYDRQRHPMNRLRRIVEISRDIEREILLRRFGSTVDPTNPQPISLTAEQMRQVRQAMALLRYVEGHNSFVVLGHQQFAGRELLPLQPALDLLEAISSDAAAEYRRRLTRRHVERDFSRIASSWPTQRDRLLQRWQEQMDSEAAERLRRPGRRRERLPVGSVPEVLEPAER